MRYFCFALILVGAEHSLANLQFDEQAEDLGEAPGRREE
jgi:hypothetical protein